MADKVIWNDDKTMNFLASEYQSARVTYPNCPADQGKHWIRIQMKGSALSGRMSAYSGIRYATCNSEEEAKACLARLTEKLALAGIIEVTENDSGNRFDHVELQEVSHE